MAVAALAGTEQWLAYLVGLISGQYYQVLGEKDKGAFRSVTAVSLAIILSMAAVRALREFATRSLTVTWRRTLTAALHSSYFRGIRYYRLNVLGKRPRQF